MMKTLLLLAYDILLAGYAISSVGIRKESIFLIIGFTILFPFGIYWFKDKSAAVFALMLVEIRGVLQSGTNVVGIIEWYADCLVFVGVYIVVLLLVKTSVVQKIYQSKVVGYLMAVAIPILLILTYINGPISKNNEARIYLVSDKIMTFPIVILIFPFVVAAMLHKNMKKTISKKKKALPVNQFLFVMYCLLILVLSGVNQDMGIAAVLVSAGFITFLLYSRNWASKIMVVVGGAASVFLAVVKFNKIEMRWMIFSNLQKAMNLNEYGAKESAIFVFENRILQHSGLFGLGLGSTAGLERGVYKTIKFDYIFEVVIIEMGLVMAAVVLFLLLAMLMSMMRHPAVNAFHELLNLSIVMILFFTCVGSVASSLNCIPPVGIPLLGLAKGHSLFLALGGLLAIHEGIKGGVCDEKTNYQQ